MEEYGRIGMVTERAGETAEAGAVYGRNGLSFDDYTSVFLAEKRLLLSPVTLQNYSRELQRGAKYLGREKMKDISFLRMKQYFYTVGENERNARNGRPLAYGTLRQHYIVLHSFFENALENGVIEADPMKKLKYLIGRERKKEMVAEALSYDEDQVRYIIRCLENEPCMWRAAVMFAIDSGCRSGEVIGLKWSDIDWENGRVIICRNIQYISGLGTFVCSPKSGRSRAICLNRPAIETLFEWRAAQRSGGRSVYIVQKEEGYCFTRRDGNPLIPVAFNNYLTGFGRRYGLPGIHPHALRHTMASLSIANGADIVSVSNKLGHANTSVTLDIYSHANLQAQRRANAALAAAIY